MRGRGERRGDLSLQSDLYQVILVLNTAETQEYSFTRILMVCRKTGT